MCPLSFTLSVLLVFVAVRAAPQGQPSGAPACTYSCPPVDLGGFDVGTVSDEGTTLFCSYPAIAGESPDDFYCKYSDVSLLQRIYMFGLTHAKSNLTSLPASSRKTTTLTPVPRRQSPPVVSVVAARSNGLQPLRWLHLSPAHLLPR